MRTSPFAWSVVVQGGSPWFCASAQTRVVLLERGTNAAESLLRSHDALEPPDFSPLFKRVRNRLQADKLTPPEGAFVSIVGKCLWSGPWEETFPNCRFVRCEAEEAPTGNAAHPLRGRVRYAAQSRLRVVYCESARFGAPQRQEILSLNDHPWPANVTCSVQTVNSSDRLITAACGDHDHLIVVGHFERGLLHVGDDRVTPGSISQSLKASRTSSYLNAMLLLACNSGANQAGGETGRSFCELELDTGFAPAVAGLAHEATIIEICSVIRAWADALSKPEGSILAAFDAADKVKRLRLFLRSQSTSVLTRVEDPFGRLCVASAEAIVKQTQSLPLALSGANVQNDHDKLPIDLLIDRSIRNRSGKTCSVGAFAHELTIPASRYLLAPRMSGKSSASLAAARALAHDVLSDPMTHQHLVVHIRLRDLVTAKVDLPAFAARSNGAAELIATRLETQATDIDVSSAELLKLIQSHYTQLICLLDGLDELEDRHREAVRTLREQLRMQSASTLVVQRSEVTTGRSTPVQRQSNDETAGSDEKVRTDKKVGTDFSWHLLPLDRAKTIEFACHFADHLGAPAQDALKRVLHGRDTWLLDELALLSVYLSQSRTTPRGESDAHSPASLALEMIERRDRDLGGTRSAVDVRLLAELCAKAREQGQHQIDWPEAMEHFARLVTANDDSATPREQRLRDVLHRSGCADGEGEHTIWFDIRFCELLAATVLAADAQRLRNLVDACDLAGLVDRADLLGECVRAASRPAPLIDHILRKIGSPDAVKSSDTLGVLSLLGSLLRAAAWWEAKDPGMKTWVHSLGKVTFSLLCKSVRDKGTFAFLDLRDGVQAPSQALLASIAQLLWSVNPLVGKSPMRDTIINMLDAPSASDRRHPFEAPLSPPNRQRRMRGMLATTRNASAFALAAAVAYWLIWSDHLFVQNLVHHVTSPSADAQARSLDAFTDQYVVVGSADSAEFLLRASVDRVTVFGTIAIWFAAHFTTSTFFPLKPTPRPTQSRYERGPRRWEHQEWSDYLAALIGPPLAEHPRTAEVLARRFDAMHIFPDEDIARFDQQALKRSVQTQAEQWDTRALWQICRTCPEVGANEQVWRAILRALKWGSACERTVDASVALLHLAPRILRSTAQGESSAFLKQVSTWSKSSDVSEARAAAHALETTARWFSKPEADDVPALTTIVAIVNDMLAKQPDAEVQRSMFFAVEELAMARDLPGVANPFRSPERSNHDGLWAGGLRPSNRRAYAEIRKVIDANNQAAFDALVRSHSSDFNVRPRALRLCLETRPEWLGSRDGWKLLTDLLPVRCGLGDSLADQATLDVVAEVATRLGAPAASPTALIDAIAPFLSDMSMRAVRDAAARALLALGDELRGNQTLMHALRRSSRMNFNEEALQELCLLVTGKDFDSFRARGEDGPHLDNTATRILAALLIARSRLKAAVARIDRRLW